MRPPIQALRFADANHLWQGRRRLTYFGGCDYLRLSGNRRIRMALIASLRKGMFNSGASRATTGEDARYLTAEKALASFFQTPKATLVGAGYLAAMAVLQGLNTKFSHVVIDGEAHASLKDAARLSGKPVFKFGFGDVDSLKECVKQGPIPVILSEGLLGGVGIIAPLAAYLKVLPPTGWMVVDDAHGAGVLGNGGRGTADHFGLRDSRMITTISLSKVLCLQGGAVLATADVVDNIRDTATAFMGNTAPLFAISTGLVAALNVLKQSQPRIKRLRRNCGIIHALVRDLPGVRHDEASPVLSVFPGMGKEAMLSKELLRRGIFPSFIRYGGNEEGYFRFALSAGHRSADATNLGMALQAGLA